MAWHATDRGKTRLKLIYESHPSRLGDVGTEINHWLGYACVGRISTLSLVLAAIISVSIINAEYRDTNDSS